MRQRRLRTDERVVRLFGDGVLSVQSLRRRIRYRRAADSAGEAEACQRQNLHGRRKESVEEEQVELSENIVISEEVIVPEEVSEVVIPDEELETQGKIDEDGETITCLPHKLTITVYGEDDFVEL